MKPFEAIEGNGMEEDDAKTEERNHGSIVTESKIYQRYNLV